MCVCVGFFIQQVHRWFSFLRPSAGWLHMPGPQASRGSLQACDRSPPRSGRLQDESSGVASIHSRWQGRGRLGCTLGVPNRAVWGLRFIQTFECVWHFYCSGVLQLGRWHQHWVQCSSCQKWWKCTEDERNHFSQPIRCLCSMLGGVCVHKRQRA